MTYDLPLYLPPYLPTSLSISLPPSLPPSLPTYLPLSLHTSLPPYLPTSLPPSPPLCLSDRERSEGGPVQVLVPLTRVSLGLCLLLVLLSGNLALCASAVTGGVLGALINSSRKGALGTGRRGEHAD